MLHCDPVTCEEYFPKLLKTVPGKSNANIVIVIDSVDKLQVRHQRNFLPYLRDGKHLYLIFFLINLERQLDASSELAK